MRKTPTPVKSVSKVTSPQAVTIGMDLGDRRSHVCVLDHAGVVLERFTVDSTAATSAAEFDKPLPLIEERLRISVGRSRNDAGWRGDRGRCT